MGKTTQKKSKSRPQIGRHFRLEYRTSGRARTFYQRWKWLRRYWAYKRNLLWKTTRFK